MYLTSLGEAFMALSSMGFTCTSLFPKVVQWSVEVLGAWSFVSSPHATRKCRLLPEAQERGLTFVIRMHRLSHPAQPIYLQDTWRAWARRRLCCGEAAPRCNGCPLGGHGHGSEGRQQQRVDMGMEAVCLFCYRSVNCCYDTYVVEPRPVGKS